MEMVALAESDELVEIGGAIVIGMVGIDPDDDIAANLRNDVPKRGERIERKVFVFKSEPLHTGAGDVDLQGDAHLFCDFRDLARGDRAFFSIIMKPIHENIRMADVGEKASSRPFYDQVRVTKDCLLRLLRSREKEEFALSGHFAVLPENQVIDFPAF